METGLREDLRRRLNRIPGVAIPEDAIGRRPAFPLELLAPAESRRMFTETFEWVLAVIRDGQAVPATVGPSEGEPHA